MFSSDFLKAKIGLEEKRHDSAVLAQSYLSELSWVYEAEK